MLPLVLDRAKKKRDLLQGSHRRKRPRYKHHEYHNRQTPSPCMERHKESTQKRSGKEPVATTSLPVEEQLLQAIQNIQGTQKSLQD